MCQSRLGGDFQTCLQPRLAPGETPLLPQSLVCAFSPLESKGIVLGERSFVARFFIIFFYYFALLGRRDTAGALDRDSGSYY